jgi:hypothetical protein
MTLNGINFILFLLKKNLNNFKNIYKIENFIYIDIRGKLILCFFKLLFRLALNNKD